MKIAIYAAKPGSKVVLVGLGQRDKMYELPITHAAVSYSYLIPPINYSVLFYCVATFNI